jgi:DNA-binding PadR family transcriptional regulator
MFPDKEMSLELQKRIVRDFMDFLILKELENGHALSGYDVIAFVHKKFNLLVSPGTAYALLYSMERKGLIKGVMKGGRRVYRLSEKGQRMIENILKYGEEIQWLVKSIFSK